MGPNKMETALMADNGHDGSLMIPEKKKNAWLMAASNIYQMVCDNKNGLDVAVAGAKIDKIFGKTNGNPINGTEVPKQKLIMLMLKEYQLFVKYKYDYLQYSIIPIIQAQGGKQICSSLMKRRELLILALPNRMLLKPQQLKLPPVSKAKQEAQRKPRPQEVRADYHIHRRAESLFSTSSGFNNFRGFLNLALLMLTFSAARVALENVIKYGVLVNPTVLSDHVSTIELNPAIVSIIFYNNINIIIACCLERMIAVDTISDRCANVLHVLNLCMQIGYPVYVILIYHPNPFYSTATILGCVIVFLKLVSYKQTRMWCRMHMKRLAQIQPIAKQNEHGQSVVAKQPVLYPAKLSFSHLYYFMFLPTICYEISFPKTKQIRKRFLMKRILETLIIVSIIIALIQQWIFPIIENSVIPFSQMQLPQMLERILKLALPNFCVWLLWFYVTFHSMFNILAEVLRFGDRNFYQDWWNSESISEFWKKWNIPVHRWATRHVYKPMLLAGYTKVQSCLVVFAISALFHEVLICVPLGLFRPYQFIWLILQVPLSALTAKLQYTSPKLCNMIMWASLVLIQPAAGLLYYADYYEKSRMY